MRPASTSSSTGSPSWMARNGPPAADSGARSLDPVLLAAAGCAFDALRARPDDPEETEPYGLLSGWVGGW
jgi:hypothetical protein